MLSRDLSADSIDTVFRCYFYPLQGNDMNPFDELSIMIEFDQCINIHTWNNCNFKIFINNIKNKQNTEFEYILEETINDKWIYNSNNNTIEVHVWDYGQYDHTLYVAVTEDILNRLIEISNLVDREMEIIQLNK